MKRFIVAPLLMLSVIGVANAKSGDGNELLTACQASVQTMGNPDSVPDYYIGYCQGLVRGMLDVTSGESNQPLLRSCVPEGVTVGQATRIVTRYLQQHPEELHLSDTNLALMAIKAAYPCQS